jgi:hypothetical protein
MIFLLSLPFSSAIFGTPRSIDAAPQAKPLPHPFKQYNIIIRHIAYFVNRRFAIFSFCRFVILPFCWRAGARTAANIWVYNEEGEEVKVLYPFWR